MKIKYRKIGLVLWTDNPIHMSALEYIKHNYKNYIYILHDKDLKEDNTFKKAHYHVLLYFENQKLLSTLKNQLHLNDSDFYEIKSLSGQLRYLIHYDDEDKYQYDIKDVYATNYLMTKFKQSLASIRSETEETSVIIEYIFLEEVCSIIQVTQFVLDNDLYSTYRRNYSLFKDILKEKMLKGDRKNVDRFN